MMQTTLDFTREYPPHQSHSDTSSASAAKTAPKFSGRLVVALKMFASLHHNGATDEEGQSLLDLSGDSYRPIRVTLTKHGLVADSGRRRPTTNGRSAVVWVITHKGADKLMEVSYGQ